MKKEYNIKDKVWIHMGERTLVGGRIVEIIDFEHLKEGHSPDREFYIIEIKTGIDDIYEVRDFEQISPDAKGPINLFRKLDTKQVRENTRYLKKVGMALPIVQENPLGEVVKEINEALAEDSEPTAEQIHAAMERSEQAAKEPYFNTTAAPAKKPKKRYFAKRKTNGND